MMHCDTLATKNRFQCSSASRKFLNMSNPSADQEQQPVSVLFSEPKIPQCANASACILPMWGFSALQRAENSSICGFDSPRIACSSFSALQRAENSSIRVDDLAQTLQDWSFSALQRAENSSIVTGRIAPADVSEFQCSSASRKFLNPDPRTCVHPYFRPRRSRFVIPEPSWCVAMTPVY